MRIPQNPNEFLAAAARLLKRASPFALGHAIAIAGHCLNNIALIVAAEALLLILYTTHKH